MSDFMDRFKEHVQQAETTADPPAQEAPATQPAEAPASQEQPVVTQEQVQQAAGTQPASEQQTAPQRNQPPQMVPVQRLAQATRAQKAAEQRYAQTQGELQGLKQEIEQLRKAAEQRQTPTQQAEADAESDDDWFQRIAMGDVPTAGLDKKTVSALQKLSKDVQEVQAYQRQQVQITQEQHEDAALDSEMERLQQACPTLPEESAVAMYAAGYTTDQIAAPYRRMVPPTPARAAQAPRAPAPPPPPQIAPPGTVAGNTTQKPKWGEFIKSGLRQRLETGR